MSIFEQFKDMTRRRASRRMGASEDGVAQRCSAQSVRRSVPSILSYDPQPVSAAEYRLYRTLKNSIPVIDAAVDKIVRLMGSFRVKFESEETERAANEFLTSVRSIGGRGGIYDFLSVYTNQLLTYGTAVGEIVLCGGDIYSLVNVPLEDVRLGFADNMIDTLVYPADGFGESQPFKYQDLFVVSALNPEPGSAVGVSVLKGLEFVSDILMKIYNTIGVNWERVGNVRFSVNYKPTADGDRALNRERAEQIAEAWSSAMSDSGGVSDFVSVGDVSIKVIGADNQILDSEVPVRQMLEQIVAKLSVPPFLLGLSWSTTERMSSQQADILTSELEHYRRLIEVALRQIINIWQRLRGNDESFTIEWDCVNLQDEVELAKAELYRAQAEKAAAEQA